MARCYDMELNQPAQKQTDAHTLVAMLVEAERSNRINLRTQLYLRLARLRYRVLPEKIHCSYERNLTKEQLAYLSDMAFIENGENVFITGATGSGKSYLACALSPKTCMHVFKTIYLHMSRFIEALSTARVDGTYRKLLNTIAKTPLLILDDFGLQPFDHNIRLALLQILEDRYKKTRSSLPLNFLSKTGTTTSVNRLSLMRSLAD